ncbi:MAG TPA: hypothetical protein VII33_20790, partial [Nakamurella sp.]
MVVVIAGSCSCDLTDSRCAVCFDHDASQRAPAGHRFGGPEQDATCRRSSRSPRGRRRADPSTALHSGVAAGAAAAARE